MRISDWSSDVCSSDLIRSLWRQKRTKDTKMADDSSHSGQKEPDSSEGGRLWRGLRALLFGDEGEHSLRKELEDAIDEYDEEEHGAVTGNGDLSPVERQMLKNLLHFGEHTVDDVAVPRAD